MNPPPQTRYTGKGGDAGPAKMINTVEVSLAIDNLVCVVCQEKLGMDREWSVVSSPKKKGMVLFAHLDHVKDALNMLAAFLKLNQVPDSFKLPDPNSN